MNDENPITIFFDYEEHLKKEKERKKPWCVLLQVRTICGELENRHLEMVDADDFDVSDYDACKGSTVIVEDEDTPAYCIGKGEGIIYFQYEVASIEQHGGMAEANLKVSGLVTLV